MTQAEFYRAQRVARNKWLEVFQGLDKEIGKIYIQAADEVAEQIKTLTLKKRGNNLTGRGLKALEKTLRNTGQRIADGTEKSIVNSINQTVNINNDPHLKYINDAIDLSETEKISKSIIQQMYATINERMIEITYSRIQQDGYTFSQRIWGGVSEIHGKTLQGIAYFWQRDVKNIVLTGFAENRDVLQIAKDIQVYAADGKIKLMKRYGELERGTTQFSKRIPKNIDWRAIRIARSELYMSMQEQTRIQGQFNPAVKDAEKVYRWNLTAGAVHECVCPDLAANSPYRETEVPAYPHPNCLCYITLIITPRDEFVQDLVEWGQGISKPYLDDWFVNSYLPFLR